MECGSEKNQNDTKKTGHGYNGGRGEGELNGIAWLSLNCFPRAVLHVLYTCVRMLVWTANQRKIEIQILFLWLPRWVCALLRPHIFQLLFKCMNEYV